MFNTTSDKILYSTYADDPNSNIYTSLSICDVSGKNNISLDIRTLIEAVQFTDDKNFLYPKLADQTASETLVKFNINNKEEQEFQFSSTGVLRFANILLNDNKDKIYFLSDHDLYSLELITNQY